MTRLSAALAMITLVGCAEEVTRRDAAAPDARSDGAAGDATSDGGVDATSIDDATSDSGLQDDAQSPIDASAQDDGVDAGLLDSGVDTGVLDTGVDTAAPDTGVDTGIRDTGVDTGIRDSGVDTGIRDSGVDTGVATGGCISGATGNYVARFRWTGSSPGSRASVSYEANTLPDRARWRVTAANRGSIGSYTPTFTDTFLGEGGLDFGGTTFMDVELSSAGIGTITSATLAIYGRSFNTTAPGSYAWMTFQGSGAAPSGLVSNSAPYRWYRADATSAVRGGISNMLLRISPGPPSGALVVSRVELCIEGR